MKITVDVECTPEEARTFLGLPDWKPVQDRMVEKTEERMEQYMQALDPQEMMRLLLPRGQDIGQLQSLFSRWFSRGRADEQNPDEPG